MDNDLKDALIKKGISPSYHRLKIYEYLWENRTHPTADDIYNAIIKQIPTLSKTTIYNTLKTLGEKGLVSSITIEDNEVRYDADIAFHGHFKCTRCGALYDIDPEHIMLDKKNNVGKKILGHLVTEKQVYYKGICKKCQH
ncbi:MAG: transcriptional repressor [Spirochaetes bacterium]|nr:transcriptional repressor [Spirochaetota bacterium]